MKENECKKNRIYGWSAYSGCSSMYLSTSTLDRRSASSDLSDGKEDECDKRNT